MKLYRWQEECLRKWKENNDHGIVDVITGAGKTVLALAAVEDLKTGLSAQKELRTGLSAPDGVPSEPAGHPSAKETDVFPFGDNPAGSAPQKSQIVPLQVRIIVPTVALAEQWKKAIHRFLPENFFTEIRQNNKSVSASSSCRSDSVRAACTIYVVNSARYSIARQIRNDMKAGAHVMLIADECHHYASPENRLCFSFLDSVEFRPELYHSLGLSATPGNNSAAADSSLKAAAGLINNILEKALGKIIYHYGFRPALRDKRISRFYVYSIALHFSGEELLEYSRLSDSISVLYRQLMKEYPGLKGRSGSPYFFTEIGKLAAEEDDPESLPQLYLNLIYQRAALTRNASARLQCVSDLIGRLPASEKIILFCERIDQAEEIYEMLKREDEWSTSSRMLNSQADADSGISPAGRVANAGVNMSGFPERSAGQQKEGRFYSRIALYHSRINVSRRRDILRLFRDGEIRILITCKALDEGLDVPDASIGIVVSSTGVRRQRVQRLGRILRPSAAKPYALLFYLHVKESSESGLYLSAERFTKGSFGGDPDCSAASNLHQQNTVQAAGDPRNSSMEFASGCYLQYFAPEHAFSFPLYEAAGAELLKRYRSAFLKEPSPSEHISAPDEDEFSATHFFTRAPEQHTVEQEIRRCLEEGLLLPDWLAPEEAPLQPAASSMIEEKPSLTRHEKNYLLIMRELNQIMKSSD